MSLYKFNDETVAAWGSTVKWVTQQVNEFIPNELSKFDMARKFIENSNDSLSTWSSQKKLRQIKKEKRAERRPNAPPNALDELAYTEDMAEAVEQANTHLQAQIRVNPNPNASRASS